MNRKLRNRLALVALVAVAAGLLLYLARSRQPAAPPSPPPGPVALAPADSIRHPVAGIGQDGPGAGAAELPSLDASDAAVEGAAADLLGAEAALALANPGDYIRKTVVTVDNLLRNRTSARLWPVQPTPGRFTVRQDGDRTYLSPENFPRYQPFVDMATSVDTGRLVALYVRYYPLFQQAYEQLGFPGQYFNDRVIDVIDNLLATPVPGAAVELVLPAQDPSVEVARPWLLYEFADPGLRSLSSGQKILIRMGEDNASRVKAKLRELRGRLAAAPGRPAG